MAINDKIGIGDVSARYGLDIIIDEIWDTFLNPIKVPNHQGKMYTVDIPGVSKGRSGIGLPGVASKYPLVWSRSPKYMSK